MRKTIILLMAFMLMLSVSTCYATNESEVTEDTTKNIVFNVNENITVKKSDKTAIITISLGDFVGIEDKSFLGFEGILEYDKEIFKAITVTGLNSWVCDYEDSTKIIMGDTASSQANTDIATVVLTFADSVQEGTTTKVKFNHIELTDEMNDFIYNKESTITIEKIEEVERPKEEETKKDNVDDKVDYIKDKEDDDTVAKRDIPQTGGENGIIISIFVAVLMTILGLIGYKKIKLK